MDSGGSAGWLSDPLPPSTSSIRAASLPAGVLTSGHQGSLLNRGTSDPSSEGGSKPAPQSPGFYNRLFLVHKASGSWHPIIDLSTLNNYITSSLSTWRLHSQSFVPFAQATGRFLWICRTPTYRFLFITIHVVNFASW